jgi:hypothetical protein
MHTVQSVGKDLVGQPEARDGHVLEYDVYMHSCQCYRG